MSTVADASCIVREARGRLLVSWSGEGFDEIKADFRRTFPRHRDAIYSPTERAWSLPAGHRRRLEAWCAGWFDDEAIDWEGGEETPAPQQSPALAAAYATLHLRETAPAELVEASRRVLAKSLHPDAGGTNEAMQAVNVAADAILEALALSTEEWIAF